MRLRKRASHALLFAVLVVPPARLPAQEKPDQLRTMSRQELDAVKVVLAQERAWNAGNIEEYASAYKDSPDTLFVADTISHGYAGIVQDLHRNFPTKEAMGQVSYTGLEPRSVDERVSVVVGRYHLDRSRKAGGNADGVFSLVMEKTEAGWKIVVDHRN
ncbi:protein of unknown function [Granulicella rosea]|uniref:DUF4440 domain-containing protein n=1 Tax=Granulicella rosea TaxID=474952 RepID=A0A239DIR8_9BACT|nr:nuclear transport factor 2 family protein [Granulicella rosea]SNS31603.1 protein of unknown function [Granulicella rosea]